MNGMILLFLHGRNDQRQATEDVSQTDWRGKLSVDLKTVTLELRYWIVAVNDNAKEENK